MVKCGALSLEGGRSSLGLGRETKVLRNGLKASDVLESAC